MFTDVSGCQTMSNWPHKGHCHKASGQRSIQLSLIGDVPLSLKSRLSQSVNPGQRMTEADKHPGSSPVRHQWVVVQIHHWFILAKTDTHPRYIKIFRSEIPGRSLGLPRSQLLFRSSESWPDRSAPIKSRKPSRHQLVPVVCNHCVSLVLICHNGKRTYIMCIIYTHQPNLIGARE